MHARRHACSAGTPVRSAKYLCNISRFTLIAAIPPSKDAIGELRFSPMPQMLLLQL